MDTPNNCTSNLNANGLYGKSASNNPPDWGLPISDDPFVPSLSQRERVIFEAPA
jgi:hypothetical protein